MSCIKALVRDLNYPTSLVIDDDGSLLIAESGLPFGGAPAGGRILRFNNGECDVLAKDLRAPVTGIAKAGSKLIISEGGHPARLLAIEPNGTISVLVDGFVGPGNYHLGVAAADNDGWLYFGIGSMTNTGVVGPDALSIGWLRQLKHAHDVPGLPVELTPRNFDAVDPDIGATVTTGAFHPFGSPAQSYERIEPGRLSTASVHRCRLDGSEIELVAWGIRNAFGLGFLEDGRLLALDQGADDRGLRPVGNVPDCLWEILPNRWYGWPDFMAGQPITSPDYYPQRGPIPEFLLTNHDELGSPPQPLVKFPTHTAATRFSQIPRTSYVWPGCLLVTLFGDERPMTAPDGPQAGRTLVRVDPCDWSVENLEIEGLTRPIDVVVCGDDVLVLDFGQFEMGPGGKVFAVPNSGSVLCLSLARLVSLQSLSAA